MTRVKGLTLAAYGPDAKKTHLSCSSLTGNEQGVTLLDSRKAVLDARNLDAVQAVIDMVISKLKTHKTTYKNQEPIPLCVASGAPQGYQNSALVDALCHIYPDLTEGLNTSSRVNQVLQSIITQTPQKLDCGVEHLWATEFELFGSEFAGVTPYNSVLRLNPIADHTWSQVVEKARGGNSHALENLKLQANKDAHQAALELSKSRILGGTRFIHFGNFSPETNNNRYTYLNVGTTKNEFAEALIWYLPESHNICIKTPADRSAPAFTDICATMIADVVQLWKKNKRYGHVMAQIPEGFEPEVIDL